MRKLNLISALVVLSLLPLVFVNARANAEDKSKAEQQIKALSDQGVQAQLKGDTSFIEKNYADDATIIHSDGKLSSKAQELDALKSGSLKYESIEVHDRQIKVYGNTAVTVTLTTTKGTLGGKPFSGDFVSTRTWVEQKGNWKLVAFQATRAGQ